LKLKDALPPLEGTVTFGVKGGPSIQEFQDRLARQKRAFGLGEVPAEVDQTAATTDAMNQKLAETNRALENLAARFELATSVGQQFAQGFSAAAAASIMRADDLAEAMQAVVDNLAEAVLQTLIYQSIMSGVGAGVKWFAGPQITAGTALFGGPGETLAGKGLALHLGRPLPYARGGIVSRPTIFPMAHGAGLAGERGPEGILRPYSGPPRAI
jgi:hypothetical protein